MEKAKSALWFLLLVLSASVVKRPPDFSIRLIEILNSTFHPKWL